jgi:hypothetical protein
MPFAIMLVVFLAIVFMARAGQRSGRAGLLMRGIPARGLILSASRTATDATVGGQRFEVRSVVLDVEVAGKAPYEVSLSAMFPRICEALPGATLDLRVDPVKPDNITVIGPAGASQWVGAAAAVPGQTWAGQAAPSRSGCGTIVIVLIACALGLASVLSFVGSAHEAAPPSPRPAPIPTPTPRPAATPVPPTRPTSTTPAAHRECEAAMRCCETLGISSCQSFRSATEAVCATALLQEKKAALKEGKHCQ